MKQILRDMKIHALISVLHLIVCIGGMGTILLVVQRHNLMQLFGLKNENAPVTNTDIFLCVMAALMVLFALYLLVATLTGKIHKEVKEFFSKLDAGEQEKILFDYQNAWRGSRTIRIGRKYTYVLDDGARILLNSDIIWLYEWFENVTTNSVSHSNCYFNVYLYGQEEPEIVKTTKKTYSEIMEYYRNNFPHIVVGDSDEARYLYRKDREQFLHLKYYDVYNKEE